MSAELNVERVLSWVREAPLLAFDTETSGVDRRCNVPVGYVLAVPGEAVYVPVRHGGGGNLIDPDCPPLSSPNVPEGSVKPHRFERALSEAFRERDRRGLLTIGHNLKFDLHMAANAGVVLNRNLACTQVQEALLDEHAGSFSLAACARRRGVTAKLGDELYTHMARIFGGPAKSSQMANFWRLPGTDPVAVAYAVGDGITTLELYEAQLRAKEREPVDLSPVWQLENDLIRVVWRIERRGFRVDEARCYEVLADLRQEIEALSAQLPEGFNPRSPRDMLMWCRSLGRTDWPTTAPSERFPDGQPSFTEKWLSTFPEGRLIVDLREATNLINSFLSPLLERHLWRGRVWPTLHQTAQDNFGTISGRFSCSDPNLQQVPKHNKKLGRLFRSVFVPDEGFVLYEGDYSQCEPRLFAHYSREPALIDGYNASPPRDMHKVAADMLGVDRDTVAKRVNMGLLTGMQLKTFAEHMGWDIRMARNVFNEWKRAFPEIARFQREAKQAMLRRGYVRTLLNRMCRLDDPRFAYKATSRIIQGGNADIVKYKLREADRMLEANGDRVQLLMSIHDSFVWQAPLGEEKTVEELVRLFMDVQSPPLSLRVPFKMDVGRGANWAEATYGDKQ